MTFGETKDGPQIPIEPTVPNPDLIACAKRVKKGERILRQIVNATDRSEAGNLQKAIEAARKYLGQI